MSAPDSAADLILRCRVRPAEAGRSLLEFLTRRFRYLDEAAWREEIRSGRVSIEGRRGEPGTTLRAGTVVTTMRAHREPPVPTNFAIVHDRDGILIVDKPAGLPFHSDGTFIRNTLVGLLRPEPAPGAPVEKLHPLLRLDRETSGLCAFARDPATLRALEALRERGLVKKDYLALVHGCIESDSLELDQWIGPAADSSVSLRRAVLPPNAPAAQPAHTSVRVLARAAAASLVACRLHTGRTHQIRAHLEGIGHPLVGDKLYGRPDADFLDWIARSKTAGVPAALPGVGAPRQMLHAFRLDFRGDAGCAGGRWQSDLPADFVEAMRSCGLLTAPIAADVFAQD
ncbi:MAG: RluA family pseudouridine synthase [Planctomycetota bacterium]